MSETEQQADGDDRIAATFRQWVHDLIHNSPASRDTEGFNHLTTAALPELERRLKEIGR